MKVTVGIKAHNYKHFQQSRAGTKMLSRCFKRRILFEALVNIHYLAVSNGLTQGRLFFVALVENLLLLCVLKNWLDFTVLLMQYVGLFY